MKKIIKYVLITLFILISAVFCYLKFALPNIDAPADLVVDATPERVERGRYLANNINLCMDCHSERDYSKFSGPPKPGTAGIGGEKFDHSMGFPGEFYSRNITPYSLKDWTDGELYRAITSGISRDGTVIFPVMPWPLYNGMATEDIYSIISYLRTLEPIVTKNKTSTTDFPVSLIKNTFPVPANPGEIPNKKNKVMYGKYLANAAACVECHSQKDAQGGTIPGTEFGGGMEFELPTFGIVKSANLTPHPKNGLMYNEEAFVARFKSYTDSTYIPKNVGAGEFQSIMPWMMYGGMTKEDLSAIYQYLRSLKPIDHEVVKFTPVAII